MLNASDEHDDICYYVIPAVSGYIRNIFLSFHSRENYNLQLVIDYLSITCKTVVNFPGLISDTNTLSQCSFRDQKFHFKKKNITNIYDIIYTVSLLRILSVKRQPNSDLHVINIATNQSNVKG